MADAQQERRVCSFCGARQGLQSLIAGLTASICHSCVADFARFTGAKPASPPPSRPRGKTIDSEVFDARTQAVRIIQEAERDAAELRQRAQLDYHKALDEARRKGYEDGLARGLAQQPPTDPPAERG